MTAGALEGLRVLDLSRLLPGPYCTWLLADMGADVTRVENPRELDKQARVFGWDKLSIAERATLREADILARNKSSIKLDIGNTAAQDIIRQLAAEADILVEDYRPGVLAGLGLGAEALRKANPALIYCSLTLCGQTGPYRDKPGHDPIALAVAGALSRIGETPDKPGFPGVPVADIVAGSHAAYAILAAVIARTRSGQGQHVDVAMSDCAMTLLVNVLSRHRDPADIPPRGERRADMGLWRTKDDKWICSTDMEPAYWRRFCLAVGRPEFIACQTDIARRPEIRAELDAVFATRTLQDWLDLLDQSQTQFAPVLSVSEALEDPHNHARGMVQDEVASDGSILRQIGPPVRLRETPKKPRNLGRVPGTDTLEILTRLGLGMSEIKSLERVGAFGATTGPTPFDRTEKISGDQT